MSTYREERIRRLAHEIWEREGHPHGRDAEHWRMATEAYEAEMVGSRLDDAGQSIEMGHQALQEGTTRAPAVASPNGAAATQPDASQQAAAARRRRTKGEMEAARAAEAAAPLGVETAPAARRKRRTKAEIAAAAAGVVGAAAAVVATVAVTKRRRGATAEMTGEAAPMPAADVALRSPCKTRGGTMQSDAEPAPAAMASGAAIGAGPDRSADGPSDVATTSLMPDPGAVSPSSAAPGSPPESALAVDSSGERVAN